VAAHVGGDAEGLRGGGDQGRLLLPGRLDAGSLPSSERAANILSRTRKVGWPQVSRSSASGSDRPPGGAPPR
jgi:hypothetical protein